MRSAIVYGYAWNAGVGPVERMAVALARAGAKVLHCEAPISLVKRSDTQLRQVDTNLFTFKPRLVSSRLNRLPRMSRIQSEVIARQIFQHARDLGIERPLFLYPHLGPLLVPLCEAAKRHGCTLVHVRTDYVEDLSPPHVGQSDLTLVFSRTLYHRMRARWGEKIRYAFFGIDLLPYRHIHTSPDNPPDVLAGIPRPRLGYSGGFASEFLNIRVLRELLERRREWNFVSFARKPESFGTTPPIPLPNAHALPWQTPDQLARCVAAFDVGFMPYDCSNTVLFNNPPMKLWDYFAMGLPVVATALIHLWEYEDLVYLGETAKELEQAVEAALAEPPDSPLREKRKDLAEKHSAEALGRLLQNILE